MLVRMNCWKTVAAVACLSVSVGSAAEPIVQDFDGWKIVIRPEVQRQAEIVPPPAPAAIPLAPPTPVVKSQVHRGAIEMAALLLTQEPAPAKPVPLPGPDPVVKLSPQPAAPVATQGLPTISPGESSECCETTSTVMPPAGTVDPRYLSQMYSEIYRSIPFNRAEYDANPSYRHDTAVEFLFGKMRPTVIHRGSTNVYHHYPSGYGVPYVYGGLGYAYPPLQLVIPGVGLRVHRSY
ncbi:MAG: hypothetical protein U0941_07945 [Planctomycetaceae bacterium]